MNHRIFERTLRPLVFRGACLFERHYHPSSPVLGVGRLGRVTATPPKDNDGGLWFPRYTELLIEHVLDKGTRDPVFSLYREIFQWLTSDQVGIRAELKHINKRRKRNQQGLPQ